MYFQQIKKIKLIKIIKDLNKKSLDRYLILKKLMFDLKKHDLMKLEPLMEFGVITNFNFYFFKEPYRRLTKKEIVFLRNEFAKPKKKRDFMSIDGVVS